MVLGKDVSIMYFISFIILDIADQKVQLNVVIYYGYRFLKALGHTEQQVLEHISSRRYRVRVIGPLTHCLVLCLKPCAMYLLLIHSLSTVRTFIWHCIFSIGITQHSHA